MSFNMIILPPRYDQDWDTQIESLVPGSKVEIIPNPEDATEIIAEADCAYGNVPPELFRNARKLRWIQCFAAGPPSSFYHEALITSDIVVTNFRGIFNDSVSHHAVALLLALSRNLNSYIPQQLRKEWKPGEIALHLPDSTVIIVGVGGIGSEVAKLCKCLGANTIGLDPRRTDQPEYLDELHPPDNLEKLLPRADVVIVTTPDTPHTRGMINSNRLNLMKSNAILINVGRGVCVVLNDLVEALQSGRIGGACLDVFEIEPLPSDHPLWTIPNVILTPHIAAQESAIFAERRTQILMTNCKRFDRGEELINVVSKKDRF